MAASLSLSRVLQNRKTSLEIERENFEKAQQYALKKAINREEAPVKQKHVRSAIIGTFSQQGAKTFWSIALTLPFLDDRITAWKLCHVLHKILREGHPLCMDHSHRHRSQLEDIGRLWESRNFVIETVHEKEFQFFVHLPDAYGKMIKLYTQLLITKLDFHKRNPRFPGNLNVTTYDLQKIHHNNPDICFQMSIEILDYIDDILELQKGIFGSLDMARSNSMTMQGQCRLAPLIPCIQDAARLYDHNVKLLFQLHTLVPFDVLSGHRDRFYKQFKQLKTFYQNANTLQYFKDLITVPPLDRPPNFQANFSTYVTQEVIVSPEEERTEVNLIDTTDTVSDHVDNTNSFTSEPSQYTLDLIAERNRVIEDLQLHCEELKSETKSLYDKNIIEKNNLHEHINTLETKLAIKESELAHEKQMNDSNALAHEAHVQDEEHKAKKEEVFRTQYLKLREEHINLLREKGKIVKQFNATERKIAEIEQNSQNLEGKLRDAESKQRQKEEELGKSATYQYEQLEALRKDRDTFKMETEVLKQSVEDAYREQTQAQSELKTCMEKFEQIEAQNSHLLSQVGELNESLILLRKDNETELDKIIKETLSENEKIMKHAIEEVDNPALAAVSCSPDYLCSLTTSCQESLQLAATLNRSQPIKLLTVANQIAHKHAMYLLQGRATSNTSPDILFGEKMADACKKLGESVVTLLQCLKENKPTKSAIDGSTEHLRNVASLAETISGSLQGETAENLADMLDDEMTAMDKAIEEAAKKMQELLSKSRQADTGIKLEVNEKIIDSCTKLMLAIRILVQKSKLLQAEIVSQGKGTASAKDFYKRNHRWTDGFISAAKTVGVTANFLLGAADKVVSGQGKLEQLVVAAHEISASTAQLVVASRVKANRNSNNLEQLSQASKGVTSATGGVVATVKDCSQLMDDAVELDTTNVTLYQAKRLEMDAQVRVLELEKDLQQERLRLSALRRRHYQLAGEGAGWGDVIENNTDKPF